MLKTLIAISQMEQSKALRILSTTVADVGKIEEVKDVPSSAVSTENLARLVLGQRFIKLVQSAILLNVNQPSRIKEMQH